MQILELALYIHIYKVIRGARRLFRAGVYPSKMWGHQAVGLEPKLVASLRREQAACSGINQVGRCATIAIAVAFGRRGDSWLVAISEVFTEWFRVIEKHN